MIDLARGTTVTVSVPSAVASMIAMVSVLLEGLLIASVARGPAVALGLPGFRETVEGSVVEVGLMLETYEFGDFLHRRCIEVLARGKESKAMLLAVGAEVPLLYFIF